MRFNNFSIRTKLILLLSLSAIFALSIFFIASAYYMLKTQSDRSLHNLTQIAEITAQNISASLIFDDEASAEKMLKPLSINPNIQKAMVYTKENILFAKYINKDITNSVIQEQSEHIRELDSKEIIKKIDWNGIFVVVPVIVDHEMVGSIKIISGTQEIRNEITNELTRLVTVGFFIVLIIVFVSFKLHKVFTEPIYRLLHIMKEVSSNNNYSMDIKTAYQDEFKDLYGGFTSMLKTIDEQRESLAFAHKQTRDSIEYSATIQQSLLPRENTMVDFFDDIFTIWKPKDTVGGDIYLFETLRNKNESLLMVIDCTGHGVPGAFVTMIVKAIEKEIVAKLIKSDFDINPAIIMAYFNKHMRLLLHQDNKDCISNAGFDGGIVYINKAKNILRFAGSNTPLFVVQNDQLKVFKGNRESIGYKKSNPNFEFTMHEVDLNVDTSVYLTTDGYLDQTGGEKGFLFGKKRFAKLIESVYGTSIKEQEDVFQKTFDEYKINQDTKDDMTLIAFNIKNHTREQS